MPKNPVRSHARPRKPWLDEKGKPLSDDVLREQSKMWSMRTWEKYLQSIESPQTEILVDDFDKVANDYASEVAKKALWDEQADDDLQENQPQDGTPPKITQEEKQAIEAISKNLPSMQQAVIQLLFWDGLSEREACEKLGISRITLRTHRDRAICELRRGFVAHFPLYIGGK